MHSPLQCYARLNIRGPDGSGLDRNLIESRARAKARANTHEAQMDPDWIVTKSRARAKARAQPGKLPGRPVCVHCFESDCESPEAVTRAGSVHC